MKSSPEFCLNKITVMRPQRLLAPHAQDIMADRRLTPSAKLLLLWMLDRPTNWRFRVAYIVEQGIIGGRNKVHTALRNLRACGYVTIERDGRDGGGFERGIYLVSSEPRWLDQEIDIYADEYDGEDGIGPSQAETREPRFGDHSKKDSRSNQDTDTRRDCGKTVPSCQQPEAERPAAAKSRLTGEAEPRQEGAACHPPKAERPAAAKGSAGQKRGGAVARKSSGNPGGVCFHERLRTRLIAAGGRALADPRNAPGLWGFGELIIWLSSGWDAELDILPVVRDVSSRAGLEPGKIRGWRYFRAAIAEHHGQRTGTAVPKPRRQRGDAQRLDPYAPPPRNPDDGSSWRPVGLASILPGGRR